MTEDELFIPAQLREPRLRVRVTPTVEVFKSYGLAPHLGELVQLVLDLEPELGGIALELDARQRLRPGEHPTPMAFCARGDRDLSPRRRRTRASRCASPRLS